MSGVYRLSHQSFLHDESGDRVVTGARAKVPLITKPSGRTTSRVTRSGRRLPENPKSHPDN